MADKKRGRPITGQQWARQRAFRLPTATDARLVELASRLGVNHTRAAVYAIDHVKLPAAQANLLERK